MRDDRDEREQGFDAGMDAALGVHAAGYAAFADGDVAADCPYLRETGTFEEQSSSYQLWNAGYALASARLSEAVPASPSEDQEPLELLTPAGMAVQEITRYIRDNGMCPVEYMHGILAAVAGSEKE